MADLGAEVIKIEGPEGDLIRARPPLRDGEGSEVWTEEEANAASTARGYAETRGRGKPVRDRPIVWVNYQTIGRL
jgi:crotonobetainyl-CoA:carnitine CoA-transferase CaiB-like acyl-CoA transferase